MVLISSVTVPSLVERGLCRAPGGEKVRCISSLFLSVTLSNDKVCEHHLSIKAFEYCWIGVGLWLWTRVQLCLFAVGWRYHRMLKLRKNGKIGNFLASRATQWNNWGEHVCVKWSYSCIGFWDILRKTDRQTHGRKPVSCSTTTVGAGSVYFSRPAGSDPIGLRFLIVSKAPSILATISKQHCRTP